MNILTCTTRPKFVKATVVKTAVVKAAPVREAVHPAPSSPNLLQGVMEGLIDGVMMITAKGELIHTNRHALRMCQQLTSDLAPVIPAAIWHCCQAAIESRELFPQQPLTIEDEIASPSGVIRIRVRWLAVENLPQSCLLVTLEDQSQSAQYRAIADSIRYGLTARETDVWRLKCAGCSYKEIAAQLYLAENTVKKHIKNIHVKRAESASQKVG
jgi:DNA-binding CsgD family transcriptional regulator